MFDAWRQPRQDRERLRARPAVEVLEDRTLPSVSLIHDINPTTQSAFADESARTASVQAGDVVYFTATNGHGINQLFRTDGSGAGTRLLRSIGIQNEDAPAISTIDHLTALGDKVLFTVDDGVHGDELWISDGTTRGTRLLIDLRKRAPDGTNGGSFARDFVEVGNRIFFTADNGTLGRELWVTDGTKAGTTLVRDIDPFNTGDVYSQGPTQLTRLGNSVAFFADDGEHGRELWRSDGTKEGTRLVRDIHRGRDDSDGGSGMVAVGGAIYFGADDGNRGVELWRSDGTRSGTKIVRDLNSGGSSYPRDLTVLDDAVWFTADVGEGRSLFRSDGTSKGTRAVAKNLHDPDNLTAGDHRLYFTAQSDEGSENLYVSDGTTEGTKLLKQIAPPHRPDIQTLTLPWFDSRQQLTIVGRSLYFTAVGSSTGRELWKTDGTVEGTELVEDIRPGRAGSRIGMLSSLHNRLLFVADDGLTGRELWSSDGTARGTNRIRDLNRSGADAHTTPPIVVRDTLFFGADDGKHGFELWKSDGTSRGTRLVKDINVGFARSWYETGDEAPAGSNIRGLTELDGIAYFVADDGVHGDELWRSDGTSAGTFMVIDLNERDAPPWWNGDGNLGSSIDQPIVFNGKLYFSADDGTHGTELWTSDGTAAGTRLVKDVNTSGNDVWIAADLATDRIAPPWFHHGNGSSFPGGLVVFNGRLWFAADDGIHGREPWSSDGTEAGTKMLRDINPDRPGLDSRSSNPYQFTKVGASLFFSADDGSRGTELWKTDGTWEGTRIVRDINRTRWTSPWEPGTSHPGSADPRNLTAVGDVLYFAADDGANGTALWRSDGTHSGTKRVKSLDAIDNLTALGTTLFFSAETKTVGNELWSSDGTSGATTVVRDIHPGVGPWGARGSSPTSLTAHQARLYFTAEDGIHGRELWTTDGTSGGTMLVADVSPGASSGLGWSSGPFPLDGILYLTGTDGRHGIELMKASIGS